MMLIEILGLSERRENRDILKNVNLRVEKGEVHALIGPTGAGKTTLLRLIALLDKPTSGKIIIGGKDTAGPERERLALRRQMGFVLQKPVVFNQSVFDNVAYGLRWRGTSSAGVTEKVNNILETVGVAQYAKRNARTLSGGEMQRVAIARALVTRPQVLLMDEPSANLDPVISAKIEELINGIIRKEKITVVMATHDMEQGQRLADNISVMVDGAIAQTGNAQEIFSAPVNRQIAEFVGMGNIIDGTITVCDGGMALVEVHGKNIETVSDYNVGDKVSILFRPEDVTVALSRFSSSARNSLEGTISGVAYSGPLCRVEIDCGFPLKALVTKRSAEEMGLKKGLKVYGTVKAVSIHVIKQH
jgi:tungstate transport system ATP-binding protein